MPANETFDFRGPAGRLEAILSLPETPPVAAAVVCHAHPLHGGVMHFKVVFRAAKALQSAGVAALRFNFRGVGRSEGVHGEALRALTDPLPPPCDVVVIPHADHFFDGCLDALQGAIAGWAGARPWDDPAPP